MLATKSDYSCGKGLHNRLLKFTDSLKQHCGTSISSTASNKELSSMEKLKKLAKLMMTFNDGGEEDTVGGCRDGHVTSLQSIITHTMIEWAGKEIQSLKLIEEVFSLLFRQFNEVGEVAQALEKTYVLEVTNDPKTGKPNFDIQAFCSALGSLRLLLKVGMSKKEENLLERSLRYVVKMPPSHVQACDVHICLQEKNLCYSRRLIGRPVDLHHHLSSTVFLVFPQDYPS